MSKNSLILEEAYTVKEFTKLKGFKSEEYVRHCCNQRIDPRTGKKAKLPKGYYAEKLGSTWLIRPKLKYLNSHKLFGFKSVQDTSLIRTNFLRQLKGSSNYTGHLDIKFIDLDTSTKIEKLIICNPLDHISIEDSCFGGIDFTGDHLIYLVYKHLEFYFAEESYKKKKRNKTGLEASQVIEQTNVTFIRSLPLIAAWLTDSFKPSLLNNFIAELKCFNCLYCGQPFEVHGATKFDFLFCRQGDHEKEYLKNLSSIFVKLTEIEPLGKIIGQERKLKGNVNIKETIATSLPNYALELEEVALAITQKLLRSQKKSIISTRTNFSNLSDMTKSWEAAFIDYFSNLEGDDYDALLNLAAINNGDLALGLPAFEYVKKTLLPKMKKERKKKLRKRQLELIEEYPGVIYYALASFQQSLNS